MDDIFDCLQSVERIPEKNSNLQVPLAGKEETIPALPCRSVWAITLINNAYGFIIAAQGLFVCPLEVQRLWPEEQSFALAALMVTVAISQLIGPPAGYFCDHYQHSLGRRRPLLILSVGVTTVFTLALWAFSMNFWRHHFIIAFLIQQLSLSVVVTCQNGLISDLVPDIQRGFVGAANAVNFLLGCIEAFVCVQVFKNWQYQVMYPIIVGLLLVSTSSVCYVGSEASSLGHNSFDFSGLWASYSFNFLQHRNFAALLASKVLYCQMGIVKSFLLFFVRDTFEMSAAETEATISELSIATEVTAAFAAFVAVFCLRGGRHKSDAEGLRSVLMWSLSLVRIGAILMGMTWLGPSILALIIHNSHPDGVHGVGPWKDKMTLCAMLWGVGQGLYLGSDQALQFVLLPDREESSRHLGFVSICAFVGTSIGGIIAGSLLSTLGGGLVSGYSYAGYSAVFVFTSLTCFSLAGTTYFIRTKQ